MARTEPRAGAVAVNHQGIPLDQLESRPRSIYVERHDKTLYILAAPSLRYKAIVGAIDAARDAGVNRAGIITEGCEGDSGNPRPRG